jgi:hypothetical protein
MKTIKDFKKYAGSRHSIRFNGWGFQNTRISRITFKALKGYLKQINNIENHPQEKLRSIFETEIKFREICLSCKDIFKIDIK